MKLPQFFFFFSFFSYVRSYGIAYKPHFYQRLSTYLACSVSFSGVEEVGGMMCKEEKNTLYYLQVQKN